MRASLTYYDHCLSWTAGRRSGRCTTTFPLPEPASREGGYPEAFHRTEAPDACLLSAEDLAIDTQIVLPFAPEIFRGTSVVDRPRGWGKRFDHALKTVRSHENLISMDCPEQGLSAYLATNAKIIEQAQDIARRLHTSVTAVVVWDGKSRGAHDITSEFRQTAIKAGLQIKEVCTL